MGTEHTHRICTYSEAEKAIRDHAEHYACDCFCRGPAREGETPWEYCGHEVHNCMGFHEPQTEGVNWTRITLDQALEKHRQWKKKGQIFRFMEDDDWVCFCCSCGCGFFRNEEGERVADSCEGSPYVQSTDESLCSLCGACIPVCAFGALSLPRERLEVDTGLCKGCSACEYACPEDAISMVDR